MLVHQCYVYCRNLSLVKILVDVNGQTNKILNMSGIAYRTRAIISCGLYTFLPHFQGPFMYCDLWPYVWLVFKSGFQSRAAYDGARMVSICKNLIKLFFKPWFFFSLRDKSRSFLRRQLMIANYRVKKFVRNSQ